MLKKLAPVLELFKKHNIPYDIVYTGYVGKIIYQVPPPWVYTRFFKTLMAHETMIDGLFNRLVKELTEILQDFGKHLAIDSKAVPSFAKHKNKKKKPVWSRLPMLYKFGSYPMTIPGSYL